VYESDKLSWNGNDNLHSISFASSSFPPAIKSMVYLHPPAPILTPPCSIHSFYAHSFFPFFRQPISTSCHSFSSQEIIMPNFLPPPLLLLLFLLSASQVSGHVRMKTPAPLDGPVATDASGNAYNSPLSGTGADFPCKGLHLKPSVDKTPKATWAAGSPAFFEFVSPSAFPSAC